MTLPNWSLELGHVRVLKYPHELKCYSDEWVEEGKQGSNPTSKVDNARDSLHTKLTLSRSTD